VERLLRKVPFKKLTERDHGGRTEIRLHERGRDLLRRSLRLLTRRKRTYEFGKPEKSNQVKPLGGNFLVRGNFKEPDASLGGRLRGSESF